jgi:hypothetical protein
MTPTEFRARMPAFRAKPPSDPDIQRWLTEFDNAHKNQAAFEDNLDNAIANWVAHKLVLEGALGSQIATAGQVSSPQKVSWGRRE